MHQSDKDANGSDHDGDQSELESSVNDSGASDIEIAESNIVWVRSSDAISDSDEMRVISDWTMYILFSYIGKTLLITWYFRST